MYIMRRGKGMKEVKKSKRCLKFLIVLLFVIGTTIAPAAAGKGDELSIKNMDEKLQEIDNDQTINTFLYNEMEKQEIAAVKIVVEASHWWSRSRDVKTFYVVGNDETQQIDFLDDYEGDDGSLWTFYPNIGQTTSTLNVLLSEQVTVPEMIRMGILAILVEKKNVPSIREIIDKSPWASSYLPGWAKNFLERFEESH